MTSTTAPTPSGDAAPPAIAVIGAGLAGLSTVLALAERGARATLVSRDALGDGAATGWAQGGIAASVGADDDAALHHADTLAAGAGLCDGPAAASILAAGPAAIARLAALGAPFDRDAGGAFRLGLEAAHSRRRIVHANGDGTGHAVLHALLARLRDTPSVTVLEHADARRIRRDATGAVSGLELDTPDGPILLPATAIVIATGGLAALFADTTNPLGAVGHGMALAARAGAALRDLEFVQFHPTAIDAGLDPMPLASEALRGEGATLIDADGARFCDELQPRDVVARAIADRITTGARIFLDASHALGDRFAARFPRVDALCRASGLDPSRDPIPVRPAAHYTMGGIETDRFGRTGVPGLWACGECAATGLHGANRLASNSLLEAAILGERVAIDILDRPASPTPTRFTPTRSATVPIPAPPRGSVAAIRPILARAFGVSRDEAGMRAGARDLLALDEAPGIDRDALDLALVIAASALNRRESRGAHARSDAPHAHPHATASRLTLEQARRALAHLAPIGIPA